MSDRDGPVLQDSRCQRGTCDLLNAEALLEGE
jgi:hypothetical protein